MTEDAARLQDELELYQDYGNFAVDNLFWSLTFLNAVLFQTPNASEVKEKLLAQKRPYEGLILSVIHIFDVVTVTSQCLVDGVVHDLVDQMMQAPLAGIADIHAGALAHGLQTLQDLDLAGTILVVGSGFGIGAGDDFFCHFLSPFLFFV